MFIYGSMYVLVSAVVIELIRVYMFTSWDQLLMVVYCNRLKETELKLTMSENRLKDAYEDMDKMRYEC